MAEDDRQFGRVFVPDARDHQYLMAVARKPTGYRQRYYKIGPVLDQGETPMCVGFGWRGWLSAELVMELGGPAASQIYTAAQALDELPMPHDGSTVRAGAKALAAAGFIQTYGWAFDAMTIRDWLLAGKGSVVVGTRWYEAMSTPKHGGLVDVAGELRGGHCYLAIGYSAKRQTFRFVNSWGREWGDSGRFSIRFQDFDRLIHEDGEACTAIEMPLGGANATA